MAPGATTRARCHNRAPVASVSVPADAFGVAPASAGRHVRPGRPGPGWWREPLAVLPGVGEATQRRAAAIGLRDIGDLAHLIESLHEIACVVALVDTFSVEDRPSGPQQRHPLEGPGVEELAVVDAQGDRPNIVGPQLF